MRRLHLIRHGPTIAGFGRPSSQWELEPDAQEGIRKLAREVNSVSCRRVVASNLTRALQTACVLAEELGVPMEARPGLEEHHRPEGELIGSDEAFQEMMSEFFARPAEVVFGTESARAALERFHRAIHDVMVETDDDEFVVSHGTVISLLIERGGNGPALSIWRALKFPDHVMLEWPSLRRINV